VKISGRAVVFFFVLAAFLAVPQRPQAAPAECDRACLIGMVDKYLAEVVAHDPSRVPFAANEKFVENAVPMTPGEGLWKTASVLPTTFKIYVPDPISEEVGFMGVMKENDKPVQLALRLKIRNGQIVEAEHVIARNLPDFVLPNLQTPRPGLRATVPVAERIPREQMLKIAYSYYTAIVESNGDAAPFADDCARRENGFQTTTYGSPPATPGLGTIGALGCRAQLNTHALSYITRIDARRVEIADPQTGLVFGLSQFRVPMTQNFVKIVGVPGLEKLDLKLLGNVEPFDEPAAHVFNVRDGKIHEIEAMGVKLPYGSKTGWE